MTYLTEDEIPVYCALVSGVTMEYVEAASVLIDAYKGVSFAETERTERVELTYKRSYGEYRGKLIHYPRTEITEVKGKALSPFGTNTLDFGADCLSFDGENSPYFSFYLPSSFMFREPPSFLFVKYKSGYKEIPEAVKRACGMLACNIKQMGGILHWTSRDDYDVKVTLGDSGVFTDEVKHILDGVNVQ